MKRRTCSCVVVMGLLAATLAHGETWGEGRMPPANAPLMATIQPGWDVEPLPRFGRGAASSYLEMNRGFEGMLVLTKAENAEPISGPLTVRFLYSVVPTHEMNWPEEEIPKGFIPKALPSAIPRREVSEETWTLPAEFPLRVPVVLPKSCASPVSFRNNRPAALIGRYEVSDATGRVLARGVMPARTLQENTRSLVGRDKNDEAMKRLTEKAGSIDRVGDLPNEMVAYRSISGIWFTDALWEKMDGREALARRLLLSGVRLSGETTVVKRIRTAVGVGIHGQVLGEAVVASSWKKANLFSLRRLNLSTVYNENEGCGGGKREESLLGNDVDLFRTDRDAYLTWTLAGLLVFSLGIALLLLVGFIRLKGERRVALWWALPAWTLLCSLGIWGGGLLVLERRPRVDVTEYRLIMQGWPEMYCRAVASAMTFEPGRPEWMLPPDSVVTDSQYGDRLDGWWARRDARISEEGIRLRLSRTMTGKTLELEAGWFEPASSPISMEKGTPETPGRWVVASEDLTGVFVMADGQWRDLGPMKAGDRLDPLKSKKLKESHLPGLPEELSKKFRFWHTSNPCQSPAHQHPPAEKPPPYDWVVVALQEKVPPRVRPLWEKSLMEGRVIWVIQCP